MAKVRSKEEASRLVDVVWMHFSTAEMGSKARLKSSRESDGSGIVAWVLIRARMSVSMRRLGCGTRWSRRHFLFLDLIQRDMSLLVVMKSTTEEASMSR